MIDGPKIKLDDFGGLRSDHDASSYYCICVPSWQLFVPFLLSSSCLSHRRHFSWFGLFSKFDSICNDRCGRYKAQGRASFAVLPRHKWECAICLFKCPAGLTTGACPHLLSLSQECPDNTSTPTRPSPFAGAEVFKPFPRFERVCSQFHDRNQSNLIYREEN